jgi:hypothetical protein
VQSFFVGALVAIGISLIVLKGSTELEDVWLNFAGIFAPVVAFVPSPNVGGCGSVLTDKTNRDRNIGNNVTAMLVMAGLAFAVLGVLRLLGRAVNHVPVPEAPDNAAWARWIAVGGYALALALYVVAWVLVLGPASGSPTTRTRSPRPQCSCSSSWQWVSNSINFHFTRKGVADQVAAKQTGAAIRPADDVKPQSRSTGT